ncbi:MAG: tandem-95 repeat protein [Calditrichaeota bacterium]|nr:tandem-95 repeat protein [Calditrichota bacterium]
MKAQRILVMIFFIIGAGFGTIVHAQEKVSAEFVSKHKPPKSEAGVQFNDGIKQVVLKDNILFAVDEYLGLQILDAGDVKNLKELSTVYSSHLSQNVFLLDSLAFLASRLDGVLIIDITDPSRPRKIARIRPKAESYWVIANPPYLYVAEADSGVMIYDISDLNRVERVSRINTGGFTWGLGLIGNYLYALDKRKGLIVYDITNPQKPQRIGIAIEDLRYARSIQFEDDYAYAANGPAGFWILDVRRPQSPRLVKQLPVEGYAHSATKSGNTLFIGNDSKNRLEFVDVGDPRNPMVEGAYQSKSHIYGAVKKDIYVYVAADSNVLVLRYNRPPRLTDIPDQTVDEDQVLSFQAQAYDPDGDAVYFSIQNAPEGSQFDSLSGKFSWHPNYEQSGIYYPIVVMAHERTQSRLTDRDTLKIQVNHVNRPPTIAEIPDYEVDENKVLTFTIPEGQDPDKEDFGKLTYTADNLPEGAQFDPVTRVFTWKPTYEQSGVYTVDFAVHDPAGAFMREASNITVHHVDRKPVLEPVPPQTIAEGKLLTFTLKGFDPDKEDQNALSYAAYNLPEGATFDPATATFSWTPTYDQSGEYKNILFVFTAGALSDSALVDITVNHVNRPPVLSALADQTVDENQLLTFTIKGEDPDKEDAGKLTFKAENLPQGAVFAADSNVFRWKPTFEQSGVYRDVSFIVQDPSGLADTIKITITVNHVNRPPVLAEIPAKVVDENQPLTFALDGSDPDKEDQGKLVYSADKLPEGALLKGNQFSWKPTFDQSGVYTITFTVSDGNLSDSKQTTITVNHVNRPPVLAQIPAQVTDENQLLQFTVTGSDPDKEDEGKLAISALNLPEGAQFTPQSGVFSWTPTFEQSGDYTVSFVILDPAGLSDTLKVPVTVNHVNRTPVFPEQPAQVVDENQLLEFKLIPATDPDKEDQGKIKYTALNLPEGAQFDDLNLLLTWTPTYDQSGKYVVEFQVTDGEFTVKQPLQITVNNVNRPPVIEAIADQQTDENKLWTLQVVASDPDKEDAGKLSFSAKNLPQGMKFDSTTAQFSWTPTYEQSGNYPGVTVKVTDTGGLSDEKSFTIVVNHVDRPPTLEAIAPITGIENSPLTIRLQAGDPDKEDEGKLVFSSANLPKGATLDAQQGVFNWTPDFLQAGEYTIQFKVTDTGGLTAEQEAKITVEDLNRAPQLLPVEEKRVFENQTLTFKITGKDEDTDNVLTYSAEGLPAGANFDAQTQTFSWTPSFEQAGDYQVTFKVSDGKEEASITVPIKVENVNRAPEFTGLNDQTVNEQETLNLTVKANDPDAGAQLRLSAENLPEGAQFDAASGAFTWTPTYEQAGEYSVKFAVSDGDTTVEKTVRIVVNNVNRPPEFSAIADQQVKENESLAFTVEAADPDAGTNLKYEAENLPEGAAFDASKHEFSWKPGFDQAGDYTVIFKVSDGEAEVKKSVNIKVLNVNRAPTIKGPEREETQAGSPIEIKFDANDPDNDNLTFSASNLPSGAQLDSQNGTIKWTPADDQTGTFTVEVKVSDGSAEAGTSVTIEVKPKPQPAAPDTTQGQ